MALRNDAKTPGFRSIATRTPTPMSLPPWLSKLLIRTL